MTATLSIIWPDLLTIKIAGGVTTKLGTIYIERVIEYIINIVFMSLLYKDMVKNDVKSIPILILTFFSSLLGVLFFFLIIAYNRFKNKQIKLYE